MPDDHGRLPVHKSLVFGPHVEAVRLLLAAAPDTVVTRDAAGSTPLDLGMQSYRHEAAHTVIEAAPASAVLSSLIRHLPQHSGVHAGTFVRAHLPLTEQQWSQLAQVVGALPVDIRPAAELAQALPAALAHSHAQARQLVRLLTDSERARLRTFALCLARLQRCLRIPLPGPLAGKLVVLFGAS